MQYGTVYHQTDSGINGGSIATPSTVIVPLNFVAADVGLGLTLEHDPITSAPTGRVSVANGGLYRIDFSALCNCSNGGYRATLLIQDSTSMALHSLVSESGYASDGGANVCFPTVNNRVRPVPSAPITIPSNAILSLHITMTGASIGGHELGIATGDGSPEVYSWLSLSKI